MLVILLKTTLKVKINWFEKFTAEVKIMHYIMFFMGGK